MNTTPFQFVRPFPLRIKATGTITLAAAGSLSLPGQYSRQDRYQIIVTNLDTNLDLQLRDSQGRVLLTIFPRTALTMLSAESLELKNPDAGATLSCHVTELFYDEGTAADLYAEAVRAAGAGAIGGGTTTGGSSGGTTSTGGWSASSSALGGRGNPVQPN